MGAAALTGQRRGTGGALREQGHEAVSLDLPAVNSFAGAEQPAFDVHQDVQRGGRKLRGGGGDGDSLDLSGRLRNGESPLFGY